MPAAMRSGFRNGRCTFAGNEAGRAGPGPQGFLAFGSGFPLGALCSPGIALLSPQHVRWIQPRGCSAGPERHGVGYGDHCGHHEQHWPDRRNGHRRNAEAVSEERPAPPAGRHAEAHAGQQGDPGQAADLPAGDVARCPGRIRTCAHGCGGGRSPARLAARIPARSDAWSTSGPCERRRCLPDSGRRRSGWRSARKGRATITPSDTQMTAAMTTSSAADMAFDTQPPPRPVVM